MHLGIHQAFSGLEYIVQNAENIDATSVQFFIRNNRNGKCRQFTNWEYNEFNRNFLCSHLKSFVIHAPYIMNPASYVDDTRRRSVQIMQEDMQIMRHLCRPSYYVLHPGAHTENTRIDALKILSETIHELAPVLTGTTLCLELMAGQGTQLLASIDECNYLYEMCKDINTFTFCVDTCHVYGAGIPWIDVLRFFESIGPDKLGVIHVNNSVKHFGSRLDRHAGITKGVIPSDVLISEVNKLHKLNTNAPIILETPGETILTDYAILKENIND